MRFCLTDYENCEPSLLEKKERKKKYVKLRERERERVKP